MPCRPRHQSWEPVPRAGAGKGWGAAAGRRSQVCPGSTGVGRNVPVRVSVPVPGLDQTAMSRLIESYGTVGLTFPRGVLVFISSTTPSCSRIARSAETFFTSLMTIFANA